MPQPLPLPTYSPSRHPIETWRHWYNQSRHIIEEQVRRQQSLRGKLFMGGIGINLWYYMISQHYYLSLI
jgi:hypothetical protein